MSESHFSSQPSTRLSKPNEALRQARIRQRWRQEQLAELLGVATHTVQRWETGRQYPSRYYRYQLCHLFDLSAQELGFELITVSALPPTLSASLAASQRDTEAQEIIMSSPHVLRLWTVPYLRNPHFTGHETLLASLLLPSGMPANALVPDFPPTDSPSRRSVSLALTGIGGIGKTQIALEYAYRAREQNRFQHILWLDASTKASIERSLLTIAQQLPDWQQFQATTQREPIAGALRWLEQEALPWLLIVDQADDLSLLPSYLSHSVNGSMLFTSRNQAVGTFATALPVERLRVEEGTELLLRRTQRLGTVSAKERVNARELVITLGLLPLAIDQAGAYIEETACSIAIYAKLFHMHSSQLLARRGNESINYPESVATTWARSLQHLSQRSPAARELLQLCAFLAPDGIPEDFVCRGAKYWPSALREAVADPFLFNQIMAELGSASLVTRQPDDYRFSLHPLLQLVMRASLSTPEKRQWVLCVKHAMFSIYHAPFSDWGMCRDYIKQTMEWARHTWLQELIPETASLFACTDFSLEQPPSLTHDRSHPPIMPKERA